MNFAEFIGRGNDTLWQEAGSRRWPAAADGVLYFGTTRQANHARQGHKDFNDSPSCTRCGCGHDAF